jgi:hypothetical protein
MYKCQLSARTCELAASPTCLSHSLVPVAAKCINGKALIELSSFAHWTKRQSLQEGLDLNNNGLRNNDDLAQLFFCTCFRIIIICNKLP